MSHPSEMLMGTPRAGTTFLSPSLLVALRFGLSSLPLSPSPAGLASCCLLPLPRPLESSKEQRGAVSLFVEPSCSQTFLPPKRVWGRGVVGGLGKAMGFL